MFNIKKSFYILLLFIGGALGANAQLSLSLDECIRIALDENPTIKIK